MQHITRLQKLVCLVIGATAPLIAYSEFRFFGASEQLIHEALLVSAWSTLALISSLSKNRRPQTFAWIYLFLLMLSGLWLVRLTYTAAFAVDRITGLVVATILLAMLLTSIRDLAVFTVSQIVAISAALYFSPDVPINRSLLGLQLIFGCMAIYVVLRQKIRAESLSRQDNQIVESLLARSQDALLVVDPLTSSIEQANPRSAWLASVDSPGALIGRRIHEVIGADAATDSTIMGTDDGKEYLISTASGDLLWADVFVDQFESYRGTKLVYRVTDITHKRESDQVKKLNERYALAIKASRDGLWDWDVVGGHTFYSNQWKSMIGIDDEDTTLTDRPDNIDFWLDRVHPDELLHLRAKLDDLVNLRTSRRRY